jgi:hypothetical protein
LCFSLCMCIHCDYISFSIFLKPIFGDLLGCPVPVKKTRGMPRSRLLSGPSTRSAETGGWDWHAGRQRSASLLPAAPLPGGYQVLAFCLCCDSHTPPHAYSRAKQQRLGTSGKRGAPGGRAPAHMAFQFPDAAHIANVGHTPSCPPRTARCAGPLSLPGAQRGPRAHDWAIAMLGGLKEPPLPQGASAFREQEK